MSEKRLCVVDSCEYCPFAEIETFSIGNVAKVKREFLKCNKTNLYVKMNDRGSPYLRLFQYCPLKEVEINE